MAIKTQSIAGYDLLTVCASSKKCVRPIQSLAFCFYHLRTNLARRNAHPRCSAQPLKSDVKSYLKNRSFSMWPLPLGTCELDLAIKACRLTLHNECVILGHCLYNWQFCMRLRNSLCDITMLLY